MSSTIQASIGQARLHYIREGEGPVLLFLHGNPAWSFLYRNIIGALRESYDCIALDLPGFGLSKPSVHYGFTPEEHAALVAAFLNRADIRNACLIAHDWGGPIGLWAMLNTDNRLTALCLGNSWAWPVNGILHFEWFARLMGGPIGRWANERHAVFVNRVIPASMKRGAPDAVTLRAYRTPFDPPPAAYFSAPYPAIETLARGNRTGPWGFFRTGLLHLARERYRLQEARAGEMAKASASGTGHQDRKLRPLPVGRRL